MAKRRAKSLRRYFTSMLAWFFTGVMAIFVSVFLLLMLLMEGGLITPANAGEKEAQREMARQSQQAAFTADLAPQYYHYIYFDTAQRVQATNIEAEQLPQMLELYQQTNRTYDTGNYVFYEDGSALLFIWRYRAMYTQAFMRRYFPNAETSMLLLALCLSLAYFYFFVRRMGGKLSQQLTLIESASRQIGQQDLDSPILAKTDIQEFNQTLASMDMMREALKMSLVSQWEAEQQRTEEIAALAHDIKTPLTVVSGNAELLLEDALPQNQRDLADAIYRSAQRCQDYISLLQSLSMRKLHDTTTEEIAVAAFIEEIEAAARLMFSHQSMQLVVKRLRGTQVIQGNRHSLVRALMNIIDNAMRYTPMNGTVVLAVTQKNHWVHIQVQDQGPGFTKEGLARATDRLWQQERSRSGKDHYGMGLYIAAKVAQEHGGDLQIATTGQGACVSLRLPVREVIHAS